MPSQYPPQCGVGYETAFFVAAALLASAGMAMAEVPRLASQVPGLTILAMTDLPAAPAASADRDVCRHLFVDGPATGAGRAVQGRGWAVTGEVPFGPYIAVSFVGGAEPATSGTCELTDGNVALFAGTKMRALVYADRADDAPLGYAIPFGTGGLRLLDGSVIPAPVADLRLIGAQDVAIVPPALVETVCNGTAEVPNIHGLPIDMARQLLAEYGWQPGVASADGWLMVQEIAAAGVPEVQDCAGTGFAFCVYGYDRAGTGLSVVTAGEIGEDGNLPSVTGYEVSCPTP